MPSDDQLPLPGIGPLQVEIEDLAVMEASDTMTGVKESLQALDRLHPSLRDLQGVHVARAAIDVVLAQHRLQLFAAVQQALLRRAQTVELPLADYTVKEVLHAPTRGRFTVVLIPSHQAEKAVQTKE